MRGFPQRAYSLRRIKAIRLDWEEYVVRDPKSFRPAEVGYLLGDPSKAKSKLWWAAQGYFRGVDQDDGGFGPSNPAEKSTSNQTIKIENYFTK